MINPRTCVLALFALLGLAACGSGGVKETLGLSRKAPDEYRVVSRPPLSVPPQFHLRPPGSGGSEEYASSTQEARSLVLGREAAPGSARGLADTAVVPVVAGDLESEPEARFLKKAGAQGSDPSVRARLREESLSAQEKSDKSWSLLSGADAKDPLVDARKEAQRIEKNKTEGKPVTEGETPQAKQKDTGVLGKMLGY